MDKRGAVTNRDLLSCNLELQRHRAEKRRKIENATLLKGGKEKPATPEEIREIFKDYLPKKNRLDEADSN